MSESRVAIDIDISKPIDGQYDLMPCGFCYNRDVAKLKSGDIIESVLGHKARVFGVSYIDIRHQYTDLLCRLRYGLPIKRKLRDWKRDAVLYGNSRSAVSDEYCLLITYKLTVDEVDD